jgi:hypothetical protein
LGVSLFETISVKGLLRNCICVAAEERTRSALFIYREPLWIISRSPIIQIISRSVGGATPVQFLEPLPARFSYRPLQSKRPGREFRSWWKTLNWSMFALVTSGRDPLPWKAREKCSSRVEAIVEDP